MGGVFLLLPQRSKHPREMVITPTASTLICVCVRVFVCCVGMSLSWTMSWSICIQDNIDIVHNQFGSANKRHCALPPIPQLSGEPKVVLQDEDRLAATLVKEEQVGLTRARQTPFARVI